MADIDADDREIRANVQAFEAALSAREQEIPEQPLRKVLLALDGSNQDPTAEGLALELVRRSGAELLVTWAYQGEEDAARDAYLDRRASEIRRSGGEVTVLQPAGGGRQAPPFEQILTAARARACDLVVVCAPYQEDFAALGRESVGTTLDILMGRSPVAVLAVREPKNDPAACLRRILLPLVPWLETGVGAAAWALRLVSDGGDLQLSAVMPEEPALPGEEPEKRIAAGLSRPDLLGVIAALQRLSAERGLGCRVDLHQGEEIRLLAQEANAEDLVTVIPCCPRDPEGTSFQRVQALVRASRNPVLIV